ncbi:Ribonuclease HI, partial [Haemophilus influenzae]
EEDIGYIEE